MGKVVIITGASAGMGAAMARHLADRDYRVFGASRRAITGKHSDGIHELTMDVTDPASVQSAVQYVIAEAGSIDAVVNNAGIGLIGSIEDSSDTEVRALFETNLFGLLTVCRAVLPHMRQAGKGHIINISSIAGKMGLPYRGIYSATKSAVIMVTEAMSSEVSPYGIAVCAILPGDFRTNVNENRKVVHAATHSSYAKATAAIDQVVTEEVANSSDPVMVARKVAHILSQRQPKLLYKVGKPVQKLSAFLHDLLPGRLFERILMSHYNLRRKQK